MSRTPTLSPSHVTSEGLPSDDVLDAHAALVGAVGQDYVHRVLSSHDPMSAIHMVQKRGALTNQHCKPLLGLLDQLGLTRQEANCYVLDGAKAQLLARLPALQPEHLVTLLDAAFPYVGIPELREVPLAILAKLHPVPASYLKQLATDKELFVELPISVQQQVWEMDRKLLQHHAAPIVAAYTWETGTVASALGMDDYLSVAPTGLKAVISTANNAQLAALRPSRRLLRNANMALRKLVAMVGNSHIIHKGISELCAAKLRESDSLYLGLKEVAFCSLRGQLTMALHDFERTTDMAKKDEVHLLVWILDACIKEKKIDDKKLPELRRFFHPYDRRPHSHSKSRKREREDELSIGPGVSNNKEAATNRGLGDAALVLRDPATLHLLTFQVTQHLHRVMTNMELPATDEDLKFLTRLLQLAVGARSMLRERKYIFPEASEELLRVFYPALGKYVLQAETAADLGTEGQGEADDVLVKLISRDEIARKVTQMYTLERLVAGDVLTSAPLLASLAKALSAQSDKALPDWAPFGKALASSLASLVRKGKLAMQGSIWVQGLDNILLRCCDSEQKVHDEVLQLLLSAADMLGNERLGEYLQLTLHNSRKSRKRTKRRALEEMDFPEDVNYDSSAGYNSTASVTGFNASTSDGRGGAAAVEAAGDGVKSTYMEIIRNYPKALDPDRTPALAQYLPPMSLQGRNAG